MRSDIKQDIERCLLLDKREFGISADDIASKIDFNDLKLVKELIKELMNENEKLSEKSYKTNNLILYKLDI